MATALRLVPDSAKASVEMVEHRYAPRSLAQQVPSIKALRLSPHGADAILVNISSSGLLAECTVRLKTGSVVAVLFEGTFSPTSVASRVVRCAVSAMGSDGVLRYHVGIAFDFPMPLDHALELESARADTPHTLAESDAPLPVSMPPPPSVRNRW
jgi:PilZ domain-containing protein